MPTLFNNDIVSEEMVQKLFEKINEFLSYNIEFLIK